MIAETEKRDSGVMNVNAGEIPAYRRRSANRFEALRACEQIGDRRNVPA
jgi:hypothetical protein